MLDVTPTETRRDSVRLLAMLALPALLAFAAGVLAALVFAGGPLAERNEQEINQLLDELDQARRSEAWLMTLSAQYIQAADRCAATAADAAGPRVTPAAAGGVR